MRELPNQDVDVRGADNRTGKVLSEDSRKTYDNGFVGLWLPRGIGAERTNSCDGKSATQEISTKNADDATCLTTFQLSQGGTHAAAIEVWVPLLHPGLRA